MSVLVRDVVTAVRHGEAALVGESCGYLVLGAADQVLEAPRAVHFDSVSLTSDGAVALDAVPCSLVEAEQSLRLLLGQLLRFVRTPCPNLRRVADRAESKGLHTLVLELEAALVPVNRRAARRSLSRLVRETARSQAQLRARAVVEEVHTVSASPSSAALGPFEESPTSAPCVELTRPAAAVCPPEVQAAARAAWTSVEAAPWADFLHNPGALGRVEHSLQAISPARAEVGVDLGPWATLIASQFVQQTPAPHVTEDPARYTEPDVFDEGLDDCPTQIFQGALSERVIVPEPVAAARDAVTAHKRTLTPPLPLHDAAITPPSLPTAIATAVIEEGPALRTEQSRGWTSLVTRPAEDPLILSPCAPPVVEVAPDVETPQLLNLVASLETPTLTEVAVEPPRREQTRRAQPFYRHRARPRAPLAEHISLLPEAEPPAPRRPSEIGQLLNRFAPEDRPQDALFEQLQNLSRVDLTPPAALVMSLRSRD